MAKSPSATNCLNLFQQGKFQDSLEALKALRTQSGLEGDAKKTIRVNEAVAQYNVQGTTAAASQALLDSLLSVAADADFVSWTHTFNKALAYFQLGRYASAWDSLLKLLENLETVELHVGLHASFLALDICFKMKMLDKPLVQKVIVYLDRVLAELKDVKKDGDVASTLYPNIARLKTELKLYKAHLHLMLRPDKQNVKSIPTTDSKDSATLFYNAKVFLEQGDVDNGAKSLVAAKSYSEGDFPNAVNANSYSAVQHNGLGCVFMQAGKFALAQHHFIAALEADRKSRAQKDLKKISRSDLESSIMYNLALSLVAGGNVAEAFSTLVAVEGYQSHSPFYWMRLGECTILHHKAQAASSAANKATSRDILPSSHLLRQQFVSGKTFPGARLIFPLDDSIRFSHDAPTATLEEIKLSKPTLDLAFGYTCFSNMLQLLGSRLERETGNNMGTPSTGDQLWIEWRKSKQEQARNLQLAARVNLAYIALKLNDPLRSRKHTIKAIALANAITADPANLSRVRSDNAALTPYKLLAFLYHAEANLRLDKVNVAIQTIEEYLKNHMENDYAVLSSLAVLEGDGSAKSQLAATREAMYSNLATAYLVQGNVEQARLFARKCVEEQIETGPSLRVTLLQIYIMLTEDQRAEVLEMLTHDQFAAVARHVAARAQPLSSSSVEH